MEKLTHVQGRTQKPEEMRGPNLASPSLGGVLAALCSSPRHSQIDEQRGAAFLCAGSSALTAASKDGSKVGNKIKTRTAANLQMIQG